MVSPRQIDLAGLAGTLTLSVNEDGWTQVVLHRSSERCRLGAETFDLIAGNLRVFLGRQMNSGMKWVFSLSELHSSVYGAHVEGMVILTVQDARGFVLATLEVSSEQQKEWLDLLSVQS